MGHAGVTASRDLSSGRAFGRVGSDEETIASDSTVSGRHFRCWCRRCTGTITSSVRWEQVQQRDIDEGSMAGIKKLLHTRYRVNDLEKTVAFYRDVLGLRETGRHKSPRGSELVFMKAPESEEEIELCSYPAADRSACRPI